MSIPSLPPAPATVLFDLDGTLLDSSRPVLHAWATAMGAMGLPPLPADELDRVIGPPTQLVAPTLLAERGRTDAAAYDEFIERFRAAIQEVEVTHAIAYPGVLDVVAALAAEGRRLAVVTSKPRQSAERVVPALGIADVVVHLEAPDEHDPEPKDVTMARAVDALAIDPATTVMVGDRHHDVDAAAAHGIATIGVTWATHATAAELHDAGAARVVDDPAALLAALRP